MSVHNTIATTAVNTPTIFPHGESGAILGACRRASAANYPQGAQARFQEIVAGPWRPTTFPIFPHGQAVIVVVLQSGGGTSLAAA